MTFFRFVVKYSTNNISVFIECKNLLQLKKLDFPPSPSGGSRSFTYTLILYQN